MEEVEVEISKESNIFGHWTKDAIASALSLQSNSNCILTSELSTAVLDLLFDKEMLLFCNQKIPAIAEGRKEPRKRIGRFIVDIGYSQYHEEMIEQRPIATSPVVSPEDDDPSRKRLNDRHP
jgi:hypothetical protein